MLIDNNRYDNDESYDRGNYLGDYWDILLDCGSNRYESVAKTGNICDKLTLKKGGSNYV